MRACLNWKWRFPVVDHGSRSSPVLEAGCQLPVEMFTADLLRLNEVELNTSSIDLIFQRSKLNYMIDHNSERPLA